MRRIPFTATLILAAFSMGCGQSYTLIENEYGEPFDVKSVAWSQSPSEQGTVLTWSVEVKNETGYRFYGPRGVGIQFIGQTESDSRAIESEAFIPEVEGYGRHKITGTIVTDILPEHATIVFIE